MLIVNYSTLHNYNKTILKKATHKTNQTDNKAFNIQSIDSSPKII